MGPARGLGRTLEASNDLNLWNTFKRVTFNVATRSTPKPREGTHRRFSAWPSGRKSLDGLPVQGKWP